MSQTATSKSDTARGVHPFRALKRFLPRGLFGRSLIIIVAPVVLLQGLMSYYFFERHLDITTQRMATQIAADIAFLINLEDTSAAADRPILRQKAVNMLGFDIAIFRGEKIAPHPPPESTIEHALEHVIAKQIGERRHYDVSKRGPDAIEIRVEVHDGVLRLIVPRERVTVSGPDIFILWMVGSSLILMGIAIVFLRNQVRPIERLAQAAEHFGKGQSVEDFKPYGAAEVRRAAQAFLTMRERIDRHVHQRTEMLAGISHDLKTPLTRLKLQLAMMEDNPDSEAMRGDIIEMEHMLDEYLQFARGEMGEEPVPTSLNVLLQETVSSIKRIEQLRLTGNEAIELTLKPHALKRCLTNLIQNALKYGRQAEVSLVKGPHMVEVHIDDDGPGIPEHRRAEAFRPFHRLDQGRNLQTGGVGLGLAIARDIARAHGGEIVLCDSPLGGLRATLRLPV